MIGTFIRLREEQYTSLKELPGDMAEHIRLAVDMYLKSLEPKVATSKSKGGQNGST